jgi:hypothetical protein
MTTLDEQETTFTVGRTEDIVRIYTSDLRHVRRLRKLAATEDFIREVRGGDDWAEFEVDAQNVNPLLAIRKKRAVSEAQRAAGRAAGARLAAARATGVAS